MANEFNFCVNISAKRDKILLIKLVRAINSWGLKDTKNWVERHIDFDEWLDDWATFDITVDAAQFGRATHHALNSGARITINSSEHVSPVPVDHFDFTREIFPVL